MSSSKSRPREASEPSFEVLVKKSIATVKLTGPGMVLLPADIWISDGEVGSHSAAEFISPCDAAVLSVMRHARDEDKGDGPYEAEYEFSLPGGGVDYSGSTFRLTLSISDNG